MSFLSRIFKRNAGVWSHLGTGGAEGVKVVAPYRQSVWVQRAIKKIAQPIAAVPIQFSRGARGGDELLEDERLANYWESPAWEAPGVPLSRFDFIEALVGWLKLSGEFFLLLEPDVSIPFPAERAALPRLRILRPDRMREVLNGETLVGWDFTSSNGARLQLPVEQVVQVKNWNPYNPWRGLSEYEAARLATEADYAAATFAKNMMQNNGDQGVYVVAKGGLPDDAQRQQIEAQLRSKREAQQRGEFRPLFLTGDIAIEDPKIKSVDTAFLESRLGNRHEIFLAFGVPPSMADKMESYSVGSASDWFMLITETCMPTAVKLMEAVERVSRILTGQDIYGWFDWDDHPVMQAVRRERLDAALKLWNVGMPMSDISDYMDLGLPEFEGDDVGYLPFSVSPVGTLPPDTSGEYVEPGAPAEPAPDEEPPEEPVAAMRRVLREDCGLCAENLTLRDPKRLATWRTHMARRRIVMKGYETKFDRVLMEARRQVLQKLARLNPYKSPGPIGQRAGEEFLFDLGDIGQQFLKLMRSQGAVGFQLAGQQLYDELALKNPWTAPAPDVLAYLQVRENKLAGVPREIYDQVKSSLETGLKERENIAQLSARVRSEFNSISKERATRIAMTETAAVYGHARDTAMRSAGVQYKQWLNSGLPNVRPAHVKAGLQKPIPIDEPYIVDGEKLMYPGDASGSPENVINCHCVSVAVPPEETPNPEE